MICGGLVCALASFAGRIPKRLTASDLRRNLFGQMKEAVDMQVVCNGVVVRVVWNWEPGRGLDSRQ